MFLQVPRIPASLKQYLLCKKTSKNNLEHVVSPRNTLAATMHSNPDVTGVTVNLGNEMQVLSDWSFGEIYKTVLELKFV